MQSPALLSLVAAVGLAASGASYAVNVAVLPPIPRLPATLGLGAGQTGFTLGTAVQGAINIIDPVPNNGVPSRFDHYASPLRYSDGALTRETSDGRAVAIGSTAGFVNSIANAAPGTLRARAVAGGGGGSVDGVATATALFVDTVTLVTGGEYAVNWDVHGSVSGGYSIITPDIRPPTRPAAGAEIRAHVWWVPIGVNLVQASQSNFFGSLYQTSSWTYEIATGNTLVTSHNIQPEIDGVPVDWHGIQGSAGAKFWVVGMLEVKAARGSGSAGTVYPSTFVTGTADFMNTVRMTIESRSNPGQSGVTSFSGHDYAPLAVPEPSSWLMFLFGGAAWFFRRRAARSSSV